MSYLGPMRDAAPLTRLLIESTCAFVSARIFNQKERDAYIKAMRRCYYVCSEESNNNDLRRMYVELTKFNQELPNLLPKRCTLFSDQNKYYRLAVEQSLDIVKSMLIRFEDGYTHPDEVFISTLLRGSNDKV